MVSRARDRGRSPRHRGRYAAFEPATSAITADCLASGMGRFSSRIERRHAHGWASLPACWRSAASPSVPVDLDEPLVADAEVVCDLVQDDASDLSAQELRIV